MPTERILEQGQVVLGDQPPIYVVGGAVRDILLNRPVRDWDFVLPGGRVLELGRRIADVLDGAYYPLDAERETARVILFASSGQRRILDFAAYRGPDLETDLRLRDFTINAMAISLHQRDSLIDPLGGASDLREKRLKPCSPHAFADDPLRILRGVRLAVELGFQITPDSRRWMRQALDRFNGVSPERQRDEFFRILEGRNPAIALQTLDILGVLDRMLPELSVMKKEVQSPPHVADVWNHTLNVVRRWQDVMEALSPEYNQDKVANWALGLISVTLGRFRRQINEHFSAALNPQRTLKGLVCLAALYHDIGKPETRQEEENGRIRFFQHEQVSADLAARRAQLLHFSNDEVHRLQTIIRNHMRPLLLAQLKDLPSRKAIYRFFRDTGPAGVDICLLSLADVLGTYGPTLPHETWARHLEVVRSLLEAWWERPEETVSPPELVNGHDLMKALSLPPGPQIGRLLDAIREAQAVGQVESREEALELARSLLD